MRHGAFKGHCAFGFWKSSLVLDGPVSDDAHGALRYESRRFAICRRIVSSPRYIKKAAKLNDDGIKVARKPAPPKKPLRVPADFARRAARRDPRRGRPSTRFSPSHRREYVEWVTEAKTDATRQKRMATAVEWLAEGKSRNWKYEPKVSPA